MMTLTEDDIINAVSKYGKYIGGEYYMVWKCGAYAAKDTRALVVKICELEGIPVKY